MSVEAAAIGLIMGAVIGGLGGGGGVLAVPALVYLLGQSAQEATASSVIIVGVAAAVGVLARIRGGAVDWRTGITFGIVGIPAAYFGTMLNHRVSQSVLLLAFAALTIVAAVAMLLNARSPGHNRDHGAAADGAADDRDSDDRGGSDGGDCFRDDFYSQVDSGLSKGRGVAGSGSGEGVLDDAHETRPATPAPSDTEAVGGSSAHRRRLHTTAGKIVLSGAAVGFLTGFLGVGGGFIVVPALVLVLRKPIGFAIGTSLLIIVLNSVSSLISRFGVMHVDWHVVITLAVAAAIGTVAGKRVADRLSGAALANALAILLIGVGLAVGTQSVLSL